MKIAIATPEQAGPLWLPFDVPYQSPSEIRRRLAAMADQEPEVQIVTMNTTVLNEVTSENAKRVGCATYEDVFVWDNGRGLVPLLSLYSGDWLAHFDLGDLFNTEHLGAK